MSGPFDPGAKPRTLRMPTNAEAASQLAIARGNFQRAFDAGQVKVYDKFKHELQKGQFVLFMNKDALVWEVHGVRPGGADTAPGTVVVDVVCHLPIQYPVGNIGRELIIVGHTDEKGNAVITGALGMQDGPTAAPPPAAEAKESTAEALEAEQQEAAAEPTDGQ